MQCTEALNLVLGLHDNRNRTIRGAWRKKERRTAGTSESTSLIFQNYSDGFILHTDGPADFCVLEGELGFSNKQIERKNSLN